MNLSKWAIMSSLLVNISIYAAPLQCTNESPCICPNMTKSNDALSNGWHVRFNEDIQPNYSNKLQIIIIEMVNKNGKNNFYCRYLDEKNKTFALTQAIPGSKVNQIHKEFWKYDSTDNIWECIPKAIKPEDRNEQCSFSFKSS